MKALVLAGLLCLPLAAGGFVPSDKQAHAAAGALIAATGCAGARELGLRRPDLWGFGLAISAGCLKEVWDRRHPRTHSCDFNDISATALGGAVVSISWRF